jgi:predicted DsbA family dithiol-disulfide isomerase
MTEWNKAGNGMEMAEGPADPTARSGPDATHGPGQHPQAPKRSAWSRIWAVTRTLLVFGAGVGVGVAFGGGGGGSRVIYSGAMTEQEGRTAYGPDNAPVTIVEYTDYQCTFCRRYNQLILPQILDEYDGKIRYVIRHFPLAQLHPAAPLAAQAAVCAEEQDRLWPYHELLFEQQEGLSQESLFTYADEAGLNRSEFEGCLGSRESAQVVANDIERGATYGVRGTPAFFINGRVVYGAQPMEAFRQTIDAALAEAQGQ